jgi:hypothetical protein
VVGLTKVVPTIGAAAEAHPGVGSNGAAHPSNRTRLDTSKPVPVTVSDAVESAPPDDGLTAWSVAVALTIRSCRTFDARFPSFTTQISYVPGGRDAAGKVQWTPLASTVEARAVSGTLADRIRHWVVEVK